jgi:ABC-type glycerol-3-phosphate transport system substrate-binding protein
MDGARIPSLWSPTAHAMISAACSYADDGTMYGVIPAVCLKTLVWYPERAFERAGYKIPGTGEELMSLMSRIRADGGTPWCMGLESGDADRWPGTDWVEDLLLAEAGPEIYDRWTFHEIPFDHPDVRRAFQRFGEIVLDDRNHHLSPPAPVPSRRIAASTARATTRSGGSRPTSSTTPWPPTCSDSMRPTSCRVRSATASSGAP